MNLIQRISPGYTTARIRAEGGLRAVRERILQNLLLSMLILAVVAGLAWLILNPILPFDLAKIAFTLAFGWLVVVVFWREMPYYLRAGTVVAIIFSIAIIELFHTSLLGYVMFWLAAFALLTSLLFGFRPAFAAILLNTVTTASAGWVLQNHLIQIPATENFFLGTDWVLATLSIMVVSTLLASTASGIVSGLHRILQEREQRSIDLEKSRGMLEDEVQERTRDITRRLAQVRTAAEISNAISQLNDPETLYQKVVELVQERFNLYYVGIFLVDTENRFAILAAGSGTAGRTMLANNHHLQIGSSSMIGWCISNRRARVALDVGSDAVRFNNPFLPRTRSELALPILNRDVALGALTVQSEQAEAFDQDDILVLQGIADGLAAAMENVRLVSELKQNLDELRGLNRAYLHQAWSEVTAESGPLSYSYQTMVTANGPNSYSITVPIMLRDQVIAHLNLDTNEPNLSPEEVDFLENLTTQTALALENARLVQKTERRADQEETLNDLSTRFSNAQDIDSILRTAVEALGQLSSVAEVSVELVPPDQIGKPSAHHPNNGQEHAA